MIQLSYFQKQKEKYQRIFKKEPLTYELLDKLSKSQKTTEQCKKNIDQLIKYIKSTQLSQNNLDICIDFIPYNQQFYLERYYVAKQTKDKDINIMIPQFISEVNQLEALCGQPCNSLIIETVNPVVVRQYMVLQEVNDMFRESSNMKIDCNILDLTNFELADSQDIDRADRIPGKLMSPNRDKMTRLDLDREQEDRNKLFQYSCKTDSIEQLKIQSLTVHNLKSIDGLFQDCMARHIDFGDAVFDDERYIDLSYMFYQCQNLEEVDLTRINQSYAIDMSSMFDRCTSFKKLDITLDTSNVKYMQTMFRSCICKDIDITKMNTSNCVQMYGMFECSCLEGPRFRFDNWDTSKVETMEYMFKYFRGEMLDIRRFDTSHVKYFDRMFGGRDYCDYEDYATSSLCLGYWQIPELTEQEYLEYNIDDLKYVLQQYDMYDENKHASLVAANLNTQSAVSMSGMFVDQMFNIVDIAGFDLSHVVNMSYFLQHMNYLEIFNSFNIDGQVKEAPELTNITAMAQKTRLMQFELGIHAPKLQSMEQILDQNHYVQYADIQYTDTDSLLKIKNAFNSCRNLTVLKIGTTRTDRLDLSGMYGAFTKTKINEIWIKSGYEKFNTWLINKFKSKIKIY